MSNFATAATVANEIVKAVDFEFAHDQTINNVALGIRAIMTDGGGDFIIGGKVKPYLSGGMNIVIEPISGHCASSGVLFTETSPNQQPIPVEDADPSLDRIDIVQVRGRAEPYEPQDRRFRDPSTGIESVENIATKKRIAIEVSVKKGSPGSVTAPLADNGFIKLAEIIIPSATVSIGTDNIKNITARSLSGENGAWSIEKTRTFNPGYLSDLVKTMLDGHNEDGSHKDEIIKATNILFGNMGNAVRGTLIPTGDSMKILDTDFAALKSVTEVISALAVAVNSLYPYANNLLSRYLLLNDTPVAASAENFDIAEGGETVMDGVHCTVGQLVLLKDQADAKQNGLYEVQTGAWNRYIGYRAENPTALNNKFVYIEAGDANHGKVFFLEKESIIGTDNLTFKESMFSPQDLPGKVMIRDHEGKSEEDKKRESLLISIKQDLSSNADMVDGMGRDLMKVLLGHGFEEMTTQSLIDESTQETMAKLRIRLNNNEEIDGSGIPNPRGLLLGDYIDGLDFSGIAAPTSGTAPQAWNDTYKNNRIILSGINPYKYVGDSGKGNDKNHFLFTTRNVLCQAPMDTGNTNAGGYTAKQLRTWLEGANGDGSGIFAMRLKQALGGDYLYTIRKAHSAKGSYAWKDYTVWLPTEIEIWGRPTYGDETAQYNTNIHFPIYQKGYAYLLKFLNGARAWYWTSTPSAANTSTFCIVNNYGNAGDNRATDATGGVAPAFCVA